MNMIVAVDKNWAIGYKNDLLVRIPADQRFFREKTTGKVVIMGRKTLESFPGGRPLKNRTNIIITRKKECEMDDVIILHSVEEALEYVKEYNQKDVYVIGGASIYEQMLPYCNVVYVTKINYVYDADTFFPNLDEKKEWSITECSEEQTYYDLEYMFLKYEKNS